MLRKLQNEPNLPKIHFPEGCLCALVLCVSNLGEVPGTFCLAQLISHTTSSCKASHRRWRWDWSTYAHLPARVGGSRWLVCSTRAPWWQGADLPGAQTSPILLTDPCGKNREGSLLLPLPFLFGVFPADQAVGKAGCLLCATSLATASWWGLQSIEQEQAWWLGPKARPSENKKKQNTRGSRYQSPL